MKISDSLVTAKDKYTIHTKQCGRNKLYASYMPRKIILGVELIYTHMNKVQASGLKSAVVKCCVSMLDMELEILVVALDCPLRLGMPVYDVTTESCPLGKGNYLIGVFT